MHEYRLWTEGAVEWVRAERAGIQRPGYALPELAEVDACRLAGGPLTRTRPVPSKSGVSSGPVNRLASAKDSVAAVSTISFAG